MRLTICLVLSLLAALSPRPRSFAGQDEVTTKPQVHEGWIDLIGESLDEHWRQVNCADSTFRLEPDPKDAARKMIHCTGKPTGVLRTAEVYENFLVEFEWRHMTKGWGANAGFFLWSDPLPSLGVPFTRSIEVQVGNFDGNGDWYTRHGDIFPIHGAAMSPDPRFGRLGNGARSMPLDFRAKDTGEWNHYRILCIDGTVQLEVNGALVTAGYHASPRRGYLCLESEGGEVHFRGMRVLPLAPDARGLAAADVALPADNDTDVRPLYDGIDLAGWIAAPADAWSAADWVLKGKSAGTISHSLPEGSVALQVDWKHLKAANGEPPPALPAALPVAIGPLRWRGTPRPADQWNRLELVRAEGVWHARLNGETLAGEYASPNPAGDTLRLLVEDGAIDFASVLLTTPRP